ncbi:MAG: hypothetical protein ACRD3C_20585 [Vicinamibacterales bacterium]
MSDESDARVDEVLDALAAADASLRAPVHVQTAVLRQWDEQQVRQMRQRPIHGRGRRHVWALVPAAAAALLGVAVLQRGSVTTSEPEASPVDGAVPVEASTVTDVSPASSTETVIATPLARPIAVPRRPRPIADAGYVIIPEPLVDPTTLHVVRVRMSRMALATLGVPLVNPDADSLVEVEMLVGADGVAQSIRHAALVGEQMEAGGER